MSWEAYRWTAKSPSELFHVLGPHGVDHLVRQALDACWRELPEDRRTLADATAAAREVLERNLQVWKRVRRPDPAAFFEDLLPRPADQFLRQAMVTTWMMMPRAGGRQLGDVARITRAIVERNLAAWDEDNATFTGQSKKKRPAAKPAAKLPAKVAPKPPAKKAAKDAAKPKPKSRAAAKRKR
jgi:hypothetical protein